MKPERMLLPRLLVLLLFSWAAGGCDPESSPKEEVEGPEREVFPLAFVEAVCAKAQECDEDFPSVYEDVEACVDAQRVEVEEYLASHVDCTYDESLGASCLKAVEALSCDLSPEDVETRIIASCAQVFDCEEPDSGAR